MLPALSGGVGGNAHEAHQFTPEGQLRLHTRRRNSGTGVEVGAPSPGKRTRRLLQAVPPDAQQLATEGVYDIRMSIWLFVVALVTLCMHLQ